MRFIKTKIHGVVDFLIGIVLIVSPWIVGIAMNGIDTWLPVILGVNAIVYSMLTDYEMGAIKLIPMRIHIFNGLLFWCDSSTFPMAV